MAAVDQYFIKMPAERRVQALAGHELILRLFPQIRLSLKYIRPTYGSDLGRPSATKKPTGRYIPAAPLKLKTI